MDMEPNKKINPEKPASKDKLHPGSGQSAQQKEKVDQAKSANTATQEAGLNKSEHEDQTKASLNKNDINQNIVDLEKEDGDVGDNQPPHPGAHAGSVAPARRRR